MSSMRGPEMGLNWSSVESGDLGYDWTDFSHSGPEINYLEQLNNRMSLTIFLLLWGSLISLQTDQFPSS